MIPCSHSSSEFRKHWKAQLSSCVRGASFVLLFKLKWIHGYSSLQTFCNLVRPDTAANAETGTTKDMQHPVQSLGHCCSGAEQGTVFSHSLAGTEINNPGVEKEKWKQLCPLVHMSDKGIRARTETQAKKQRPERKEDQWTLTAWLGAAGWQSWTQAQLRRS